MVYPARDRAPEEVGAAERSPVKIALVVDWPSIDAPASTVLSEWEWQVTNELMKVAGFKPDIITFAHPIYVKKWNALFVNGKVGGELLYAATLSREILIEKLKGYDIALTMGQHAMFCLTGETKIDTYRGTHIDSPFVEGLQVVPTYAPGIFARLAWNERPVVVAAMRKATRRFVDKPRTIYIPENIPDLYAFSTQHIGDEIVFDVETNRACRITEFSVATSSSCCLYVQLEDRAFQSAWSERDELDIWLWLRFLADRKDLAWGFHNATYDLTYLDKYVIRPKGHVFDTMLRHHAWQTELEKSLGFLASMHIPTRAWKHLRTKAKKDFNKASSL
jgi:hypothetical protein